MYSVKKNVLQTIDLIKAYNIQHIVLSPGSRNSPLIQSFSQDPFFDCHVIIDERNAAFYALGIIQATQKPVVVCCTSGTAVLNYAPAVAEAYYQQLPLIVISADRTPEWIGQMDGQTIPQPNIFGTLARKSVQIPEINNEQDEWYCNRLINEALMACSMPTPAPVHINISLSEPLFNYSEKRLTKARKITHSAANKTVDMTPFARKWEILPKRMIVVGQLPKSTKITNLLEAIKDKHNCIIICEHISNCVSNQFIGNHEAILYQLTDDEKKQFAPDLLITLGGHIVSKRLKEFIRSNKPKEHWLLSADNTTIDLYQSLTDIIETDIESFIKNISSFSSSPSDSEQSFSDLWHKSAKEIKEPKENIPYSDLLVMGHFIKSLPHGSHLHLANSSSVRNAQLYSLHKSINVYSNRGTNGIESSLPTAIGFASVSKEPIYLVIGDLSFFYSVGALWNMKHIQNLRILLINNGGGGIFHLLPQLNKSTSLKKYVAAEHNTNAQKWAEAAELKYLSANNKEDLSESLSVFFKDKTGHPILLEASTDMETSTKAIEEYYQQLKNKN